jgi:hypothetical protein
MRARLCFPTVKRIKTAGSDLRSSGNPTVCGWNRAEDTWRVRSTKQANQDSGERKVRSWGASFVGEASPTNVASLPCLVALLLTGKITKSAPQVKHLFKTGDM